ncbi:DUF4265 domain-containing protein [Actinoplanes sp. Pm04-4]|uniref:DUF4265 domain-containing protein n=1 Tax=Paractinoplanes pyxinae TaxID=2997416 RepID=A0ABT4B0B0_9ACTN|nr:DUF4265 domain-containing protein [Actinoplanes pyxinae]MCY1139928.1 DUF4265 domain-containing protein [Actinoplanes pyxinae]
MSDVTPAPDVHVQPDGAAIKIWFKFVPRPGYLPYDTEGLWATGTSPDTARIDNVPFLQDGIAQGDVVRFRTDAEGRHWALERVRPSGHCVIRVLPIPSGPLGRSAAEVHARIGLGGETFGPEFPLVAFDVPADADFAGIKRLLAEGQAGGWWHSEVGCGSDRWWDA